MSAHYYDELGQLVPAWTKGAMPGPSTILAMIRDPELESLRRMQGDEEMDQILERTSERGTRVHKHCEDWIAGKSLNFAHFEDIEFFVGFQNWCEKYRPHIVESELFVMSERYKYAGTLDLVVELDGELWIIDIKTGMFRDKHGLQLKFYEQAYYEMRAKAAYRQWLSQPTSGQFRTTKHVRMGVLGLTDKNVCGYRKLKETKETLVDMLAHKRVFDRYRRKHPVKEPAILRLYGQHE